MLYVLDGACIPSENGFGPVRSQRRGTPLSSAADFFRPVSDAKPVCTTHDQRTCMVVCDDISDSALSEDQFGSPGIEPMRDRGGRLPRCQNWEWPLPRRAGRLRRTAQAVNQQFVVGELRTIGSRNPPTRASSPSDFDLKWAAGAGKPRHTPRASRTCENLGLLPLTLSLRAQQFQDKIMGEFVTVDLDAARQKLPLGIVQVFW